MDKLQAAQLLRQVLANLNVSLSKHQELQNAVSILSNQDKPEDKSKSDTKPKKDKNE